MEVLGCKSNVLVARVVPRAASILTDYATECFIDNPAFTATLRGVGLQVIHAYAGSEDLEISVHLACEHPPVLFDGAGGQSQVESLDVKGSTNGESVRLVCLANCQRSADGGTGNARHWRALLETASGNRLNLEFSYVILFCDSSNAETASSLHHARKVSSAVLRGKQVIVVGDGCEAWDTACAISLLNGGQDLQLVTTAEWQAAAAPKPGAQAVQDSLDANPAESHCRSRSSNSPTSRNGAFRATATVTAATPAVVSGTALLEEARRRALQAALQPHYTLSTPGAVGRMLRAPTKRHFWAYVKGKAERAVRRNESQGKTYSLGSEKMPKLATAVAPIGPLPGSSGAVSSEPPVVVWAPKLRDPRVMPFLTQRLKQVLLSDSEPNSAAQEEEEANGGADGVIGSETKAGCWWDAPSLVLYRGMAHPGAPGLLFLGLQSHAASTSVISELQVQWMMAHLLGKLPLPSSAAMRADISRQRAWCAASLAHPLMSTRGSLARTHERHYEQQLLADLDGLSLTQTCHTGLNSMLSSPQVNTSPQAVATVNAVDGAAAVAVAVAASMQLRQPLIKRGLSHNINLAAQATPTSGVTRWSAKTRSLPSRLFQKALTSSLPSSNDRDLPPLQPVTPLAGPPPTPPTPPTLASLVPFTMSGDTAATSSAPGTVAATNSATICIVTSVAAADSPPTVSLPPGPITATLPSPRPAAFHSPPLFPGVAAAQDSDPTPYAALLWLSVSQSGFEAIANYGDSFRRRFARRRTLPGMSSTLSSGYLRFQETEETDLLPRELAFLDPNTSVRSRGGDDGGSRGGGGCTGGGGQDSWPYESETIYSTLDLIFGGEANAEAGGGESSSSTRAATATDWPRGPQPSSQGLYGGAEEVVMMQRRRTRATKVVTISNSVVDSRTPLIAGRARAASASGVGAARPQVTSRTALVSSSGAGDGPVPIQDGEIHDESQARGLFGIGSRCERDAAFDVALEDSDAQPAYMRWDYVLTDPSLFNARSVDGRWSAPEAMRLMSHASTLGIAGAQTRAAWRAAPSSRTRTYTPLSMQTFISTASSATRTPPCLSSPRNESAGDAAGAVGVMQAQIAALRAHLLNPSAHPFPDILGDSSQLPNSKLNLVRTQMTTVDPAMSQGGISRSDSPDPIVSSTAAPFAQGPTTQRGAPLPSRTSSRTRQLWRRSVAAAMAAHLSLLGVSKAHVGGTAAMANTTVTGAAANAGSGSSGGGVRATSRFQRSVTIIGTETGKECNAEGVVNNCGRHRFAPSPLILSQEGSISPAPFAVLSGNMSSSPRMPSPHVAPLRSRMPYSDSGAPSRTISLCSTVQDVGSEAAAVSTGTVMRSVGVVHHSAVAATAATAAATAAAGGVAMKFPTSQGSTTLSVSDSEALVRPLPSICVELTGEIGSDYSPVPCRRAGMAVGDAAGFMDGRGALQPPASNPTPSTSMYAPPGTAPPQVTVAPIAASAAAAAATHNSNNIERAPCDFGSGSSISKVAMAGTSSPSVTSRRQRRSASWETAFRRGTAFPPAAVPEDLPLVFSMHHAMPPAFPNATNAAARMVAEMVMEADDRLLRVRSTGRVASDMPLPTELQEGRSSSAGEFGSVRGIISGGGAAAASHLKGLSAGIRSYLFGAMPVAGQLQGRSWRQSEQGLMRLPYYDSVAVGNADGGPTFDATEGTCLRSPVGAEGVSGGNAAAASRWAAAAAASSEEVPGAAASVPTSPMTVGKVGRAGVSRGILGGSSWRRSNAAASLLDLAAEAATVPYSQVTPSRSMRNLTVAAAVEMRGEGGGGGGRGDRCCIGNGFAASVPTLRSDNQPHLGEAEVKEAAELSFNLAASGPIAHGEDGLGTGRGRGGVRGDEAIVPERSAPELIGCTGGIDLLDAAGLPLPPPPPPLAGGCVDPLAPTGTSSLAHSITTTTATARVASSSALHPALEALPGRSINVPGRSINVGTLANSEVTEEEPTKAGEEGPPPPPLPPPSGPAVGRRPLLNVLPEKLMEAEAEACAEAEARALPGQCSPAWVVRRISEAKQERLVSEVSAWLREALHYSRQG